MFKAKKCGATPASGIQGYPTLASSELQAWPKVPGHSLTLGAPPSPVPSIDSGTEGGFWEKKYRLSIGINIECVHAQSLGRVQLFATPWTAKAARFLCPWNFPGKVNGVGCYFLLQGIFLTQGLNPGLLHWQADSLPQSYQGSLPLTIPRYLRLFYRQN